VIPKCDSYCGSCHGREDVSSEYLGLDACHVAWPKHISLVGRHECKCTPVHTGGEHGQADKCVDQVWVWVCDVHGHDLGQTGLGQYTRAREEVESVLAPNFVTQHTPA